MANRINKIADKREQHNKEMVNQRLKQPATLEQVFHSVEYGMKEFKKNFMKNEGKGIFISTVYLNALISLLIKKNIFTEKEFNHELKLFEEERKKAFKEQEKARKKAKKDVEK